MKKDEFTLACMGCGLSVSKVGAIKDDEFEYGFIKEKKILTCVGDDVPLDDIVELCYRESEHTLMLTYEKGNVVHIPGAKLSKEDAASLLKQMVMPTCLMELNSIMDKLFPGIEDKLYFDVLNEQMAFYPDLLGIKSDTPNKTINPY